MTYNYTPIEVVLQSSDRLPPYMYTDQEEINT